MFLTATLRDDNGESLGVIVLKAKAFRTGSVGYHGQAKVELEGLRYQCQAQLVKIAGQDESKVG